MPLVPAFQRLRQEDHIHPKIWDQLGLPRETKTNHIQQKFENARSKTKPTKQTETSKTGDYKEIDQLAEAKKSLISIQVWASSYIQAMADGGRCSQFMVGNQSHLSMKVLLSLLWPASCQMTLKDFST